MRISWVVAGATIGSALGVAPPVVGQGFSVSGLAGYEAVASVSTADLDNGAGIEFLVSRYWSNGLELGFGYTLKLHDQHIICFDSCPDVDGPVELEFYTLMAELRYWFGDAAGAKTRVRPFLTGRVGFARYVADFDLSGVQFGTGGGVWYRLFRGVGLIGAGTLEQLLMGPGNERRGRSFSTTRMSVKAGIRLVVS